VCVQCDSVDTSAVSPELLLNAGLLIVKLFNAEKEVCVCVCVVSCAYVSCVCVDYSNNVRDGSVRIYIGIWRRVSHTQDIQSPLVKGRNAGEDIPSDTGGWGGTHTAAALIQRLHTHSMTTHTFNACTHTYTL